MIFDKLICFLVVIKTVYLEYAGEDFPVQYLEPDGYVPTDYDIDIYLDKLFRLTTFWVDRINITDTNTAFAAFMTVAVLKRTLRDYKDKVEEYEESIKFLIHELSSVIAHYKYEVRVGWWNNLLYKVSRVLEDDTTTVYSLGSYKRGILRAWILNVYPVNEFAQSMDRLSFPREKYIELITHVAGNHYRLNVKASDRCISRLYENIDVLDNTTLHPCKVDHFCRDRIFLGSSAAYSLSHKLFNNMLYIHNRRCYHISPSFDISHMDMMCAAMYRETVYIARRGYFARDLFLEHIAFCGQLGHEEFHRWTWFQKAVSWIDEEGCMKEDYNFMINRTRLVVSTAEDQREARKIWRNHYEVVDNDCHQHQMALAMLVFANAIRYTAHKKVM